MRSVKVVLQTIFTDFISGVHVDSSTFTWIHGGVMRVALSWMNEWTIGLHPSAEHEFEAHCEQECDPEYCVYCEDPASFYDDLERYLKRLSYESEIDDIANACDREIEREKRQWFANFPRGQRTRTYRSRSMEKSKRKRRERFIDRDVRCMNGGPPVLPNTSYDANNSATIAEFEDFMREFYTRRL